MLTMNLQNLRQENGMLSMTKITDEGNKNGTTVKFEIFVIILMHMFL